jgi:hypothetical protein
MYEMMLLTAEIQLWLFCTDDIFARQRRCSRKSTAEQPSLSGSAETMAAHLFPKSVPEIRGAAHL